MFSLAQNPVKYIGIGEHANNKMQQASLRILGIKLISYLSVQAWTYLLHQTEVQFNYISEDVKKSVDNIFRQPIVLQTINSGHNRCNSVLILGVNIRSIVQESLGNFVMAAIISGMQRRPTITVLNLAMVSHQRCTRSSSVLTLKLTSAILLSNASTRCCLSLSFMQALTIISNAVSPVLFFVFTSSRIN